MFLYFQIAVTIIIGIGLFIYAIDLLSKSLEKSVTKAIKKRINYITDTPSKGALVGMVSTFFTQSSSIVVLTLIGLVNAGVINLERSVGVILGAEVGTTITAQIVSLDATKYILPILLVGAILAFAFKKDQFRQFGLVSFSFGLLFLAMEFMKFGASPLRDNPGFLNLFESFGQNPALGFLIGMLFTALVSSSSATTSVLVAMGVTGVIDLKSALVVMFGSHIGTCVLEIIAAIRSNINAKRVAFIQLLVNLIGVALFFPILTMYVDFISQTADDMGRQIANAHTFFSVANSIILLPFVGRLTAIAKFVIKDKSLDKNKIDSNQNSMSKPRLLIFASGTKNGGGSGFANLIKAVKNGVLNAEIVGVVSNHIDGGVKKHAEQSGIKFVHFEKPYTEERYKQIIADFDDPWVALSGWLKLTKGLNPKKTFNIHPGPLPEFGGKGLYGHYVHEAVFDSYKKTGKPTHSKVSMHFVTDEYDKGPIFFEKEVSILDTDTAEILGSRVNQAEHKWQPVITNLVINEKISWDGENPESLDKPEMKL